MPDNCLRNAFQRSLCHHQPPPPPVSDEVEIVGMEEASRKRDTPPAAQGSGDLVPEKVGRTSPPKTEDGAILGDTTHCSSYLATGWTTDISPTTTVPRSPAYGKWFAFPEIGVHRGKLFAGTPCFLLSPCSITVQTNTSPWAKQNWRRSLSPIGHLKSSNVRCSLSAKRSIHQRQRLLCSS